MPKPRKWKGKVKKRRKKVCSKCLSPNFEIIEERFIGMAKLPSVLIIKCKKCGYEGEAIEV